MRLKLIRRLATSRVGFLAAGAGAMYFFDPERGRGRRTRTVSYAGAVARREARDAFKEVEHRVHHLQGTVKGDVARATGHGVYHPESDVDLREHLRQVIHTLPGPTGDINVDVCNGKATLRGQATDEKQHALVTVAVAGVPGVTGVEDFLHLPGQEAPNKAAALHASDGR